MIGGKAWAGAICAFGFLAVGTARADEPMDAEDIRADIVGRRIYLAAPLGGELPLFYRKDGYVDGSGEAVGLGKWVRPTDSGRWWIAGDQLCQQFTTWYDGKRMCFDLKRVAGDKVFWRRDNGQTGVARIGK